MSNKGNHESNPNAGSSDPRLRSFLRQAAAIIAAERGLNERSRIKLQSLADHIGLPRTLLEVALQELQQSDEAFVQLNHWERAFVKQLSASFESLPRKILTVSGEARIVANAESRFQINPVRARQLIDHCAEKMGIARVSLADAREYVTLLIGQKIGDQTSIDDSIRGELHQVGREWGVEPEFVDQQVLDVLNVNRLRFRPGRNRRVVLLGLVTVAMAIAMAGASFYLWQSRSAPDLVNPPAEPLVTGDPTVISLLPSWWSETTAELAGQQQERKSWVAALDNDLRSNGTEQRQQALVALIKQACAEPTVDEPELFQLISALLVEEPVEEVFIKSTDALLELLSPPAQPIPSRWEQVRESLAAGRLAIKVANEVERRIPTQQRAQQFQQALGVQLGESLDRKEQIDVDDLVAVQVITDYWNQLIQTSWSSPSRASNLLKPLLDFSKERYPPVELNQFRSRALLSILKADASQWRTLDSLIADAVEAADEVKLQQWIAIYSASRERAFQDFLGPRLLAQSGGSDAAQTRQEVAERLAEVQAEFRYRRHQPLLDRHRKTQTDVASALGGLNIEGNLSRPNIVAQLVHLSNQSLSLSIQVRHAPACQFERFDRLASAKMESLADQFALTRATGNRKASGTTPPSVSELKNKSDLLRRLSEPDASPSSRQSALDRLANLAHRFEDLEYAEAALLASYLLSDLKLGEWLNVEKNLSSFRHWPNLGLAIADQLPNSRTSVEQVLTLLNVLFQREFKLQEGPFWRRHLSSDVVQATSATLESRLKQDPPPEHLDWQRLRLFLAQEYELKYRLLKEISPQSRHLPAPRGWSPVELARWSVIALERDDAEPEGELLPAQVAAKPLNELEQLVALNQALVNRLGQVIEEEFPGSANDARQIVDTYVAIAGVRTRNGERLLLIERAWLQMCELYRELLIRELLERT